MGFVAQETHERGKVMGLQVQEIVRWFGVSIQDAALEAFLVAHGFQTQMSLAKLRRTGSHNIVDAARGIELMFCEREAFEARGC
jgi:hypothetical protein